MGKTGVGSSWLTAVKRAFRSPAKENSATDNNSTDTRSSTGPRHHHHTQQHGQIKKKERKGWLFRKPTNHEATHQTLTKNVANDNDNVSEAEQRHAIAVAVATAKAAEAAVATAQAAMEVARLAAPSSSSSSYAREHYAATVVQTAFRGYLARRALRALKGVVKLQALIRGHNARSQAKMTLRCMQALVRVQAQVLDQRVRRSNDSSNRKSTFSDTNRIWDSHHLQDASDRKSMSRNGSSIADEWDERMHTLEEVKALKRERNLSQAFSQQMWRNNRNKSFGNEEDLGPRQDRWTKRSSTDRRNDPFFKTVEIDNTSHYLLRHQNSPRHRHLPATPLHSRPIPAQARSASPCYNRPQSPSLKSNYFYNGPMALNGPIVPNYMAETESARARVRAQSAPRQRPATPERERGERMVAKKRLSYNNVKDHARVEQQSNYSSCYSDSIGGEISPSSTTDLRKWLR